jgi:nucleoside-diphosphate-sugar epimerase
MKRVIITGATGAIGVALIQEFITRRIEVLVLCRKGSRRNQNIPVHPLVETICCPLEQLADLQNNTGKTYDTFYHLAWEGTMGSARDDMYLQNRNVRFTMDAVNVAQRFGCKTFVGAGSQAEYGRVEGVINGETPTFPENGYGIAKLCAGQMSRIVCGQKNIRHIWARILSIYGPYDQPNTMVMSTIGKLLQGETPALTKGEQKWDYLYSKDAARALVLLAEHGVNGKTYCIGSGKAIPLITYAKQIRDAIDKNAALGIGEIPYSPKQVMYLCADISDLTEDTGFTPVYTFGEGTFDTVTWYKQHYGNSIPI